MFCAIFIEDNRLISVETFSFPIYLYDSVFINNICWYELQSQNKSGVSRYLMPNLEIVKSKTQYLKHCHSHFHNEY